MTDYLGAFLAEPRDLKHYGVPGMQWGVRRSRAERAAAKKSGTAKKEDSAKKETSSPAPVAKKTGNIQDNVESSANRYARLDSQAKSGRASDMTEQDLKFYNARTDALAKINKMNEVKPSWLRETATTVVQSAAQRQMQMVANSLADKYVGDPIKLALKSTGSSDDED